jgi:hypothetical protein
MSECDLIPGPDAIPIGTSMRERGRHRRDLVARSRSTIEVEDPADGAHVL